jgi:hypothetical protein
MTGSRRWPIPWHRFSLQPGSAARRRDEGSLPIAMLLMIVGVGLSAVLAGSVSAQQRTTRVDLQRTDAVNAAQAGLDVALAQIRAAVDITDKSGDISKLPCNKVPAPTEPAYPQGYAFSGTVGPGSPASYKTEIYYLGSYPQPGGLTAARAAKLACTPGSGTAVIPQYALIAATGTGGLEATRTLFATYTFASSYSNPNIPGGQIRMFRFDPGDTERCFSRTNIIPTDGEVLFVRPCNNSDPRQEFAYEANLNLVAAATRETATPMCLDGGAVPTANAKVRFRACVRPTVPRQQWGQNDYSAFQGTTDGINLNEFCMNVSVPNTDSDIITGKAASTASPVCYDKWDDAKTTFPDSDLGTGRAGSASDQLVNNEQFGRCIDITGDDVDYGHLIVYPCKQKPSGRVQFNQEWIVPAIPAGATSVTGPIYTTCPAGATPPCATGKKYCLTSPGSIAASQYVTVAVCPAVIPANMTWTYREDTGVNTTSNRIESTYNVALGQPNFCLSPSTTDLWYTFSVPFSKLVLAKCTASDLQKWNMQAVTVAGALKDIVER